MNCNLCDNKEIKRFISLWQKDGFEIVRCNNCSLVQRSKLPSMQQLNEIYSMPYFVRPKYNKSSQGYLNYLQDEEFLRLNSLKRLKMIEKIYVKRSLLDVGCAAGFFIDEAKNNGWKIAGIEFSKEMAQYARNKLNIKVYNMPFHQFESDRKFDVITMWDYIEHSLNPKDDIKKANRLLKSGGILALTTGDVSSLVGKIFGKNWHLLTPRHHNYYFDKKTIRNIIEKNNFKIIKIKNRGNYFPLRYLIHKIMPIMPKYSRSILQKIQESNLGNLKLYINLFDIMTIIAKKDI